MLKYQVILRLQQYQESYELKEGNVFQNVLPKLKLNIQISGACILKWFSPSKRQHSFLKTSYFYIMSPISVRGL